MITRRLFRITLGSVAAVVALIAVFSLIAPQPANAYEATRRTKVYLVRHFQSYFHRPPQFMILGSSRSMRANPTVLGAPLHLKGINLGVGSGATDDAYAFLKLMHSRYPRSRPGVLWMLDIEAMRYTRISRYLRATPALLKYLPGRQKRVSSAAATSVPEANATTPATAASLAAGAAASASVAIPRLSVRTTRSSYRTLGPRSYWYRNGYLAWCSFDYRRAHGQTSATRVNFQLRSYARVYRNGGWPGISAHARWCATQVVKMANKQKVAPVIVLTPYHPRLRGFIAKRGWLRARAEVKHFFRKLSRSYHLRLIDMTSVSSFGGGPDGFYDGVHPRPAMTRKLLRVVLKRAGRLLRPAPDVSTHTGLRPAIDRFSRQAG